MQILIAAKQPRQEWTSAIEETARTLSSQRWTVTRGHTDQWIRGEPADINLVVAGHDDHYEPLLADVAATAPDRLPRTILLGIDLGWEFGTREQPPGTLPALLEQHRLGGAFTSSALVDWQEAPSPFAGPTVLMPALRTNAFKGYQSRNYCCWFGARGATLGAFLVSYLPVLDRFVRTGEPPTAEPEE